MADLEALLTVTSTLTSNNAASIGKLNIVDATSSAITITLPVPTRNGTRIAIQKIDSSANTVTISGSMNGTTTTVLLYGQYEARTLVATGSTWRLLADHRTKTQMDAAYLSATAQAGGDVSGTFANLILDDVVVGSTVGSASAVPIITFDNKGRITNTTSVAISGGGGGGSVTITDNGDGTSTVVDSGGGGSSAAALPTTNSLSVSAYTLALSDSTNVVEYTGSSTLTLTIPTNTSVAFPIGSYVEIFLYGTGSITIAGASGVTLLKPSGARLATQYASAAIRKRGTNEWVVAGQTVV
jgi:hypothetical protein